MYVYGQGQTAVHDAMFVDMGAQQALAVRVKLWSWFSPSTLLLNIFLMCQRWGRESREGSSSAGRSIIGRPNQPEWVSDPSSRGTAPLPRSPTPFPSPGHPSRSLAPLLSPPHNFQRLQPSRPRPHKSEQVSDLPASRTVPHPGFCSPGSCLRPTPSQLVPGLLLLGPALNPSGLQPLRHRPQQPQTMSDPPGL